MPVTKHCYRRNGLRLQYATMQPTPGDGWVNNYGWLTAARGCSWNGIIGCNGDGSVTQIRLSQYLLLWLMHSSQLMMSSHSQKCRDMFFPRGELFYRHCQWQLVFATSAPIANEEALDSIFLPAPFALIPIRKQLFLPLSLVGFKYIL